MTKKTKIALTGSIGILLALILPASLFLMVIRAEFTDYLAEKYPEQTFAVGFTKVDLIYGRFYARVTCWDDYTSFPISQSFKTGSIDENYLQNKNRNQYNAKIQGVFAGSGIEKDLKSVTGGGKAAFTNSEAYEQININLTEDAAPLAAFVKIMEILKEHDISARSVIVTYEKDKHVYEICLSTDDYPLTEKELKAKVVRIK